VSAGASALDSNAARSSAGCRKVTAACGSFAWAWGGGHNVTHVTNVSNGNTVALNTTRPGKFTFNADGSVTIDGTGHWLVGYFPGDSPSFSLVYYSGHIVLRQSMTGQLTLVSYVGAPQDVCSMIA
jgi:hypothetical protein